MLPALSPVREQRPQDSMFNANVKQDVRTVASGGTVTGAILGSKDSHIHVGEERNPPRDSL